MRILCLFHLIHLGVIVCQTTLPQEMSMPKQAEMRHLVRQAITEITLGELVLRIYPIMVMVHRDPMIQVEETIYRL